MIVTVHQASALLFDAQDLAVGRARNRRALASASIMRALSDVWCANILVGLDNYGINM